MYAGAKTGENMNKYHYFRSIHDFDSMINISCINVKKKSSFLNMYYVYYHAYEYTLTISIDFLFLNPSFMKW